MSVVIPCYYSEATIAKVVRLTSEEIARAGYPFEFILVNDGSTDGTFDEIRRLAYEDPRVIGVNCAKNLGQHSAIMAGLRQAQGDYIMVMDDDMQTHPSQCRKLLETMESTDCDVVFASWKSHKEALWRRLGSKFTDWTMRVMTKRPKDVYSSNFMLFKRVVCDEVVRYDGPYIYIQGLLFRATSNMANVEVEHFEREQGQSGYTMKSLIRLWSTVLNFSMLPLRLVSFVGSILGLVGLIAGIVVVVSKALDPTMTAGWPSLMAAMLFCSGVVLISLGLIGEYLGRVFMTINRAPQYVIREVVDRRKGE